MRATDIFPEIAVDLERCEAEILKALDVEDPLVREAATHLLRAGGKRIRPALVFLGARFHHYDPSRLLPLGAAVEMIHMATLIHDDVVDSSTTRRGRPTVNAKWSDKVSVLTGDFLFARAFMLVATYGTSEIIRILGEVVFNLSLGEIQQLGRLYSFRQDQDEYLDRIAKKTARFIAACCDVGAIASGAPPHFRRALHDYGFAVGMGFQIVDDVLDFTSSVPELGKPIGNDLRSGVYTLPLIYALQHGKDRVRLRELCSLAEIGDEEVRQITRLVEASGAFRHAFELAEAYIGQAKAALADLPPVSARDTLAEVADFILIRNY